MFWRNGRGFGVDGLLTDMEQQVNGEWKPIIGDWTIESSRMTRKLRYFQIKGTRRPTLIRIQISVIDQICQTEPLHGARPRQTERERPPVINDRSGVFDLEAAGDMGGRKMYPGTSAAARMTDLTERGGDDTTEGGGGRPAPEPQGSPSGARAVPRIFSEVRPRDGGPDRWKDVGCTG